MNAIAAFTHECLASGNLLLALGALCILPFLAWALTRPALAVIAGHGAALQKSVLFAALASLPGISFAVGTAMVVAGAYRAHCLTWLGGREITGLLIAVFAAFLIRAGVRAYRRQAEVAALLSLSEVPNTRLMQAAHAAGIAVRQVRTEEKIFCLVGIVQPIVLVSEAAYSQLNDGELKASLAHERAHADHCDPLFMAVIAFCADLFPMPVDDLIERYRMAREYAADYAAIRSVEPLDLAQAIRHLSAPKARSFGAALIGHSAIDRVRVLLAPELLNERLVQRKLTLLIAAQTIVGLALIAAIVPLSTCRMVS